MRSSTLPLRLALGVGVALLLGLFLPRDFLLRLRRRSTGRRMALAPLAGELASPPEGTWLRVSGQVLPGATFTSATGIQGCVLASYAGEVKEGPQSNGNVRREVHALDFALRLAGGEHVRVEPEGAMFFGDEDAIHARTLEEPALASRTVQLSAQETRLAEVHREQVITVGDEIEVFGQVQLSPDPLVEDGYRGSRLGVTLRGGPKQPLAIRLVIPGRRGRRVRGG
jgi:hypothetical protein